MLLWAAVAVAGVYVAVVASRHSVDHAVALATSLGVPPFIIGITIMAVGTDLPEVANSIVASYGGHGDLNVGDSIGSAATQLTLGLGLLPWLAGPFVAGRERVRVIGVLTVAALALGALLVSDGMLGRVDAALLVLLWLVGTVVVWRVAPGDQQPELPLAVGRRLRHTVLLLLFLGLVGAGAAAAVTGLVRIAEALSVPLYLVSFFGASIGTSLPEVVVDVTALRRGQADLAIGDIFGSSMVDATLSIGIGPLLAPTAVTAALAVRGGLAAAVVVAAVTLLLSLRARHTRVTGTVLLLLYAAFYPLMLSL